MRAAHIDSPALTKSGRRAVATMLVLLAANMFMHVFLSDNGDKSWLLLAADMWLHGKKLYIDIVEINPPLILWFYAIPVWISEHTGLLTGYEVLGIMGLLAAALAIALSLALIRRHPMFAGDRRRQGECVLLLAAIFVFVTPQSFFFDREHILYLMTFPYVLRFTPSLRAVRLPLALSILIGLTAAFGFSIKPHALLLFAVVQLMVILRERAAAILISVENIIVMLGVSIYVTCIWQFAHEYIAAILPMAIATYGDFTRAGGSLLCLPPILLCLGLSFADFRARYATPYRADIYYYIAVAFAFLVHSIISNGWDYTYHPLMCTALLLSGWLYCDYQWLKAENERLGRPVKQFVFGMRGCVLSLFTQCGFMALVTMTAFPVLAIQHHCANNPECGHQDAYVKYVEDHSIHSFGTISQDFPKWVMLTQMTGARWDTRFNHLWMLPKLLSEKMESDTKHAWVLSYTARALASDLDNRKPEIVFVDIGRQYAIFPHHVDLTEWLSSEPAFKAAWAHYRYDATIDQCKLPKAPLFNGGCEFNIYRRLP